MDTRPRQGLWEWHPQWDAWRPSPPPPSGCIPPAHPTAIPQVHSLQELRRSASLATKVFVQRDYSDGTTCQFQTKFPPELESRVGCLAVCVGVPYIQSPIGFV